MSWFPQLTAGTLAQFPVVRSRQWRTISNQTEGGELISLPDSPADRITWDLQYQDLSDAEAGRVNALFASAAGQAGVFGFVDPLANVIAWSEDLSRPDWQAGLLQVAGGVTDPLGGTGAWTITNPTAGELLLQQTLGLPGEYVTCFSAWVRAANPGTVVLARDASRQSFAVTSAWKRVYLSGAGAAGSTAAGFGVAVAAGQRVQVFGLQVEAQPYPSAYKPSSAARGIYAQTRFATDELQVVSTGVGRSDCRIQLISRLQE